MEKLNLVIVNDFAYVNGGTAKIALGSAVALANSGHRVTFFSAVGPVAPELSGVSNLAVVCLDQKEILNDPNRIRAITQGFWNRTAEIRMRALLTAEDPHNTIIHMHGWTKALSASVVRAALDRGFRVVVTLHDYFAACPAGTFFQFPQQKICALRPLSAACVRLNCDARNYGHKLWRVGRTWVQHNVGHLPSGVRDFICISSLSEAVLRPYLPPQAAVHRVANFIDVRQGPPVNVGGNSAFVYSGRFSAEKGALLFAQAAVCAGVDGLFVGDGPLRQEVSRIAPDAEITGWLEPAEALAQLGRARALVFPSLWYETQGLVVAEAAALGIAAVVPDSCAAREWVEDGVTGLWFRGGDAASLEEKLRLLKENPQLAGDLGSNAYRRFWHNPPSLLEHCGQLESVYRNMIADRASVRLTSSSSSAVEKS